MYKIDSLVATNNSESVNLYCSACSKCGRKYFPYKEICAGCLESLETVEVSSKGKIFSYTTIHIDSQLYKAPYTLGFIDLDEGVRLLARIRIDDPSKLRVGSRVKGVPASLGLKNGETIESFEFELMGEE